MDRNLMPYGAAAAYRPEWGRRRKKSSMSYVTRVQSLLSKRSGEKLTSYEIAVLADITVLNFQRHAAEMVENDYISRVKRKGDVCYRYFLSDEQLEAYKQRTGRGVSDDDIWIKVTPDTMPPSLQDVDVFIEGPRTMTASMSSVGSMTRTRNSGAPITTARRSTAASWSLGGGKGCFPLIPASAR